MLVFCLNDPCHDDGNDDDDDDDVLGVGLL